MELKKTSKRAAQKCLVVEFFKAQTDYPTISFDKDNKAI